MKEKEEKKEKKEKKNKKESKVKPVSNKEKENYGELIKGKAIVDNIEIDLVYNDDQINFAPYEFTSSKDNRSFFGTYWSFFKCKQSILFTFVSNKDNILSSTKIALFILFLAFFLFNDIISFIITLNIRIFYRVSLLLL